MKFDTKFIRAIMMLANEKGTRLREVCHKIGISDTTISAWGKGEALPNEEDIRKLCVEMNASEKVDELLQLRESILDTDKSVAPTKDSLPEPVSKPKETKENELEVTETPVPTEKKVKKPRVKKETPSANEVVSTPDVKPVAAPIEKTVQTKTQPKTPASSVKSLLGLKKTDEITPEAVDAVLEKRIKKFNDTAQSLSAQFFDLLALTKALALMPEAKDPTENYSPAMKKLITAALSSTEEKIAVATQVLKI